MNASIRSIEARSFDEDSTRMSNELDLIKTDIHAFLALHEQKDILRFLTCGSVDDGKSTMIGRLLHDSNMIYEDQLEAVRRDSQRTGSDLDLALLVDGLQAEREQGITIDVAYRYFATPARKFIIADCPGHEQYTRNMATGASNCDVAVILIDARHGVLPQTKRHTFITSLLGIRQIVVAVNKMDLVRYDQAKFKTIEQDYRKFISNLPKMDVQFVPISATEGDNIVRHSTHMPWYAGRTILEQLEAFPIASDRDYENFAMFVQRVNRPNSEFRGYSGTIATGVVKPGDQVQVLPSGQKTMIKEIVTMDGSLSEASSPMSVTLVLEDDVDVSRGDVISDAEVRSTVAVSQDFSGTLVWMHEKALKVGKQYIFKHGASQSTGSVESIHCRTDIQTMQHQDVEELQINEVGYCEFALDRPIVFDSYESNRTLGAFIVIDRLSNITVGAGMIGVHSAKMIQLSVL